MTLFPLRDIDQDRLAIHGSGLVLLRISEHATVTFADEDALDDFLQELDRERAPGHDPWRPEDVDAFHEKFQGLTAQPRTRLRGVG